MGQQSFHGPMSRVADKKQRQGKRKRVERIAVEHEGHLQVTKRGKKR